MSDQILLTGIRAFGYHGLFDFEAEEGQNFLVDPGVVGRIVRVAGVGSFVAEQKPVHKPQAPVKAELSDIAVKITRSR